MPSEPKPKAVVLLSGGLDSATVLAMAAADGFACYCMSFAYGQRHGIELDFARHLSVQQGAAEHIIADIDLRKWGGSALTDDIAVPDAGTGEEGQIPITYVPARNTIFLSFALGWAEVLEAERIYIGANALDYSGYPDCRPEFIEAYQRMADTATRAGVEGHGPKICAPLMNMTKAQIIREGTKLGVDYSLTISCYAADAEGRSCGRCDSCRLRMRGFEEAGIPDPTRYC